MMQLFKGGVAWDGKEGVPAGHDVVMVPAPLLVSKQPLTIKVGGDSGEGAGLEGIRDGQARDAEASGAGDVSKIRIPVKALQALEAMNARNREGVAKVHAALHALQMEDQQSVSRIAEQLGAVRAQIRRAIRRNVDLRKRVWVVHKLPGFPGLKGVVCYFVHVCLVCIFMLALRGRVMRARRERERERAERERERERERQRERDRERERERERKRERERDTHTQTQQASRAWTVAQGGAVWLGLEALRAPPDRLALEVAPVSHCLKF